VPRAITLVLAKSSENSAIECAAALTGVAADVLLALAAERKAPSFNAEGCYHRDRETRRTRTLGSVTVAEQNTVARLVLKNQFDDSRASTLARVPCSSMASLTTRCASAARCSWFSRLTGRERIALSGG
jgi:hypothetical protein